MDRFRPFAATPAYETAINNVINGQTEDVANHVIDSFTAFNISGRDTVTAARMRNNGAAVAGLSATIIGRNFLRIATGFSTPAVSTIASGTISGIGTAAELFRGGNAASIYAGQELKTNNHFPFFGRFTHLAERRILESRFVLGTRWSARQEQAYDTHAVDAERMNYVRRNLRYLINVDTVDRYDALDRSRNGITNDRLTALRDQTQLAWSSLNQDQRRQVIERIISNQRWTNFRAGLVTTAIGAAKGFMAGEIFNYGEKAVGALTEKVGNWWKGFSFNQGPKLVGDHNVNLQPGMESIRNGHVVTRPTLGHYSVKGYSEGVMKQDIIQYDLQYHASDGKNYLKHLVNSGELTQAQINSNHLLNNDGTIDYKNFRFAPHSTYDLKLANDTIHHMTDAYGNRLSQQLDNAIYNNGVINLRAQIETRNPATLFGNAKGFNVDILNATRPGANNIVYMAPFVQDSAKETIDSLYQFSQTQPTDFLSAMKEFINQSLSTLTISHQEVLRKILLKTGFYTNQFDWSKLNQTELNFLQGLNLVVANIQQKVA